MAWCTLTSSYATGNNSKIKKRPLKKVTLIPSPFLPSHTYKGKLTTSSATQCSSQPWVPHHDSTYQPLSAQWYRATRWLSRYGVGLASADRLPVVVRIPAAPLGSLKCDPPKDNGRRPQKICLRNGTLLYVATVGTPRHRARVLDRPLNEAKALVEITAILESEQAHPLLD